MTLLHYWGKWEGFDDPKQYVNELVNSRDGLFSFLISALVRATSQGIGDHVVRIHWSIKLSTIEQYIDVESVKSKLELLNTEKLNDEENRAIKAFNKALKRREDGKSEDSWFDID